MPEQEILWVKMWRLDRATLMPEQVSVAPLADPSYVLVAGESHTSYKGGYFRTPELAFAGAEKDARRSIRYGEEQLERIARARARYEKEATT